MDISKIDDITELKALAFDQLQALNLAQFNLNNIQKRIEEVQNTITNKEDKVE